MDNSGRPVQLGSDLQRGDMRRYAAILVLREIASCMPTFFFQNVSTFFDVIFNPIRDSRPTLRESAVFALRAGLIVTTQRETAKQTKHQHFVSTYLRYQNSLLEMTYSAKLQCASLDLESFNEFFCFDFQSWYKQCYDTAVSSLAEIDYAGGVRPREDRMHGALLVMAELLRCANANWERINRELEELMPAQASSVSAGKDLILQLHFVI